MLGNEEGLIGGLASETLMMIMKNMVHNRHRVTPLVHYKLPTMHVVIHHRKSLDLLQMQENADIKQ